jgi:hypothetical protein
MTKKIKLIFWSSRLNASCQMAFFKVPYSRTISQIRIFNNNGYWEYSIYLKNGNFEYSNFPYKKLSQAINGALNGK